MAGNGGVFASFYSKRCPRGLWDKLQRNLGGLPNILHKGRPMRADEMTFFQIQKSSFSSAMMSFVLSPFPPKAPQKILNLVPKTRQKIAHLANWGQFSVQKLDFTAPLKDDSWEVKRFMMDLTGAFSWSNPQMFYLSFQPLSKRSSAAGFTKHRTVSQLLFIYRHSLVS